MIKKIKTALSSTQILSIVNGSSIGERDTSVLMITQSCLSNKNFHVPGEQEYYKSRVKLSQAIFSSLIPIYYLSLFLIYILMLHPYDY